MPLEPSAKLGAYEVLSLIGAGGMGEVYRAKDTKLGREVAIKVLPAELSQDKDRLARFEREAKLLAALNHPCIATLYGFEESEGTPFLVMELVEGETLAERIARGDKAANLAIVEPRLSVVVSSCYMTSWKQLWFDPGPQDSEQDFAHFLERGFDFPDFAIAFAPRPSQILSATQDFFPIEGARSTFEEARRVYEVLGESERVGFFEYDDGHGWSKPRREATYRWLERWLHDRVDDGVEPEIETELESDLYVTQTGQVSTSYPEAETVQSINRAEAERDYPKRTAARLENPGELRQLVSSRLMMRKDRSTPRVSHHGEVGRDGYRIEKIVLQTEKGIDVPALVLVPRDGPTQKPAVLYVNAAGKSVDSDMEALARAGHVVMAPDPRGIGESRPHSSAGGYSPLWQTFQRALLVGKTLAGMQVEDLLAAFDYLASREDVDPERVAVLGKGNGGVLGLFVAVLEPRVEKLAIEGTVPLLSGDRKREAPRESDRHHRARCPGRFRSSRLGSVPRLSAALDRRSAKRHRKLALDRTGPRRVRKRGGDSTSSRRLGSEEGLLRLAGGAS